jgi:exodeoxyribonuclease VII large subunit
MPADGTEKKIFRLRSVAKSIQNALLEASKKQFWVQAQFVPSPSKGSHCYGELVDHDDKTGKVVAKFRTVIWRDDMQRIQRKLQSRGQERTLDGGQKICALVAVRYHEVYGLSLQISDVDPEFGDSHIEVNRRRILEALQSDGLLDKNKHVNLVAASLRVGLITAPKSAAYADFTRTLETSAFGFDVRFARATMQGEQCSLQVSRAIRLLVRSGVDVICIIRGGGSPMELACFDNEQLATQIAGCGVPVWVGIGHEIDITVLNFVAHTPHKTPTAVAEALVSRVRELDDRVEIARDRLRETSTRMLASSSQDLQRNVDGLREGLRKQLEISSGNLRSRTQTFRASLADRASTELQRHAKYITQLRLHTRNREESARRALTRGTERLQIGTARLLEMRRERVRVRVRSLQSDSCRALGIAEQALQRNADGMRQGFQKHLKIKTAELRGRVQQCRAKVTQRTSVGLQNLGQRVTRLDIRCRIRLQNRGEALQRTLGLIRQALNRLFDRLSERLEWKFQRLDLLRPERMLARGYSITTTADGTILRSADVVETGDIIVTRLGQGKIRSMVEETNND